MKVERTPPTRQDLVVAILLAQLLQKLEKSPLAPDAAQYRSVVQHLRDELSRLPRDAALDALLDAHPAAAALYENLNYRHAGLCRAPLEAAARAEVLARQTIERLRSGALPRPAAGGRAGD